MDSRPAQTISARDVADRWLDLQSFDKPPLTPALSGLAVEYRIVQLYSRDAGQREASLAVDVGQGTQDIGFRNDAPILFRAVRSTPVTLRIVDERSRPTTASLIIRDEQSRLYPSPGKRLAPDFDFQPQVYRNDGDVIRLAPGRYTIDVTRGPEYVTRTVTLDVGAAPVTVTPRARALDRSPGARLVFRRPPHSFSRLPALRNANAGRRAARHDPPHPRRGA